MKPNRKRNKQIIIRLTEDELASLNHKVEKSKLSREVFIRELIRNAKIIEQPDLDYHRFITVGNQIGNNLNQLVRIAHTNKEIDEVSLETTLNAINEFYKDLDRKVRGL